jgi:drug/metabolite transporter (DMT)-like permease
MAIFQKVKLDKIKSHLLVFLATVFIAGSFIASAKISGIIHPISLTLLRFVIAALGLLPFVLLKGQFRRQVFNTMARSLIISMFYSGYFICLFESLNFTSALNTGTLFTLVPFLTAVLCIFIFKSSITYKQMIVYLLAAVGTLWVIFNGDLDLLLSFSLNKGDLIFIVGVFAMCGYSIAMKLLYRNDDMIILVFCTVLGGAFWMVLTLLFLKIPLQWHLLQGDSILYIIYLAIIATLGTSYLHQKTTVTLGPARVMAYIYLNPACVALLLFILTGESVIPLVVPGIILSTTATIILQLLHTKSI